MKYIVETKKSMEQVSEDLIQSVNDHKFGVLHFYNLKEIITSKGIDSQNECKVFEVCNPNIAQNLMNIDMSLNLALPCRISIYEENEKIFIGMIKPKSLLIQLSNAESLNTLAEEAESTMMKIIQQAI